MSQLRSIRDTQSLLFRSSHQEADPSALPRPVHDPLSLSFKRTFRHWTALALLVLFAVSPTHAESPPALESPPQEHERIDWQKERQFWSFQPPRAHAPPKVRQKSWPRQPLDFFILARLEQIGIAPAPEATRETLIRRLSFDLTGLPPTPQEIDAFLRDRRRDAYERVVDRLLNSPRFGERMASLWLPLVRYAEDQAHQVGNDTKFFYPNAYKYRAWVIDAFNRDLPYNEFIKRQLAADQLNGPAATNELAALGLIGLGPKYYNRGRIEVMADEWEDRVDTVTRALLGLTVACARCHDHKFDPITMSDYYALAGVFASTRMLNRAPDGTEDKAEKSENMHTNTVHAVQDGEVKNLNLFLRGNVERKGPVVERRFLQVLSRGEPEPFREGSGRKELAEAIASDANPLTARVLVNRMWGAVFGEPLVSTPSNFGHSGQPPTHPELLDDLAVRFMKENWSLKTLVREMVLSATYRQNSQATERARNLDPANQWFGRMHRRRLTIEQWRDAALFVTGDLDLAGGKSVEVDDPENHRRTLFARISRLKLNDVLMQFDYPDANVHAETRAVTTTATQKLFLLNSEFVLNRARALAARLNDGAKSSSGARVRQAYALLFGRAPSRAEMKIATDFLAAEEQSPLSRWEQYAHLLLVSNEMFYLD
ncbi:MAG: DUF1549 and DUF1553 domain-containing protein [Verrucomicrobiota bacterium]